MKRALIAKLMEACPIVDELAARQARETIPKGLSPQMAATLAGWADPYTIAREGRSLGLFQIVPVGIAYRSQLKRLAGIFTEAATAFCASMTKLSVSRPRGFTRTPARRLPCSRMIVT